MVVTLESLRAYLRAKDSRIDAKTDEQLNGTIRYGIHNLAHQILCFYITEIIPLSNFQKEVDIFYPEEDNVINYYDVKIIDINSEEVYPLYVKHKVQGDNSVEIRIDDTADIQDMYLLVRYFYAPEILEDEELTISAEVYHFMKHALQVVMWGSLKDYEKEQYHQNVLDTHARTTTLTYPNDMPFDKLKGGFI